MKRLYWLGLAAALVSLGFYLIWAGLATASGFPLDDAWIHQVFARNLAQRGEFSYNPGQPVAGSTSPLWTFLLVPGYIFGGTGYQWWAYALGLILLALCALEVARLYRVVFPDDSNTGSRWPPYFWAGLYAIFEWRLVWAAGSGMETLLFTWGTLWLLRFYLQTVRYTAYLKVYLWLGFVGGLLTLVRPEGMVLLGLIGLDLVQSSKFTRRATRRAEVQSSKPTRRAEVQGLGRWVGLGLGWFGPIAPYLFFNYSVSGKPLPTTFYAKASGYASDHSAGALLEYFGKAGLELFGRGPVLFLVPGLLVAIYLCLWKRAGEWRPLVWPPVVLTLYAIQLPVTYQHGRYLMPLIPVIIIYSIFGTRRISGWLTRRKLPLLARMLPVLLVLPLLIGWFNQAQAYRFDVKLINDEQVRVGQWLHDNTPPEAHVASHDIGAIGYFSGRILVDTAGLVSPEFVPLVLNQPAILAKLRADEVQYLALFPDWYGYLNQLLRSEGRKVFEPAETYLAALDKENMVVFKLK